MNSFKSVLIVSMSMILLACGGGSSSGETTPSDDVSPTLGDTASPLPRSDSSNPNTGSDDETELPDAQVPENTFIATFWNSRVSGNVTDLLGDSYNLDSLYFSATGELTGTVISHSNTVILPVDISINSEGLLSGSVNINFQETCDLSQLKVSELLTFSGIITCNSGNSVSVQAISMTDGLISGSFTDVRGIKHSLQNVRIIKSN